ncbi:hypothetical protein RDI58_028199 [Solanum bulbocastanum]|uniref:Uncharacterized protein n=1 Tax=Solanum bulbocastanum TaxID=147425 RepID=A0AAN8XYS0_SOLBU
MQIITGGYMDDRGWSLLHIVARKVKRLFNEGMDANVTAKSLGTPLHHAAKETKKEESNQILDQKWCIFAR